MQKSGCALGIDHGEARIGLALSDPSGKYAFPLDVFPHEKFFKEVSIILDEYGIDRIVVGMPLTLSGEIGHEARKVEKFIRRLKAALPGIPIDAFDERLTSKQAESLTRSKKSRKKSDAMAAAIMLDTYLNRQRVKAGS